MDWGKKKGKENKDNNEDDAKKKMADKNQVENRNKNKMAEYAGLYLSWIGAT